MNATATPQGRIDLDQVVRDHVAASIAAIVAGDRCAMQREYECLSALQQFYVDAIQRGDAVPFRLEVPPGLDQPAPQVLVAVDESGSMLGPKSIIARCAGQAIILSVRAASGDARGLLFDDFAQAAPNYTPDALCTVHTREPVALGRHVVSMADARLARLPRSSVHPGYGWGRGAAFRAALRSAAHLRRSDSPRRPDRSHVADRRARHPAHPAGRLAPDPGIARPTCDDRLGGSQNTTTEQHKRPGRPSGPFRLNIIKRAIAPPCLARKRTVGTRSVTGSGRSRYRS